VAMLVQSALVVSDNEAHNDLFDLAGFDELHRRMWRMGLSSVRMRHRLGVAGADDARRTPRVELVAKGAQGGDPVIVPQRHGTLSLGKNEKSGVLVGKSHVSGGRVVNEPMSFEDKNEITIADLQELMVAVVRPDLREEELRPRLGENERKLLLDSLRSLPSGRGVRTAVDVEHKPMLPGIERVVPRESLTYASKSGRAYGFSIENAYVLDARSGRSFFITAVLYANADGRVNDDQYDYDTFALPVFAELGEVVARHVFDAT
jgi:hypothetical protein